jgi:GrpB-like predicted nucleotidyltransferase (UPF0157 family)
MSAEEPVRLELYNPDWPHKFEEEKKLIEQTLGSWIVGGIEHVGSTSILGFTAKPTIDIMIGVRDLQEARACVPIMQSIGYLYSDYRNDVMHWFCKPSFAHREFHAYLMEFGSLSWKIRTGFRNYLRSHSEIAQEYLTLKKDLASKFQNDREAYTNGKAEFIERISNLALNN